MKMRELTFSRGGTVNQGNFNNIRFDVSATVALEETEDAQAAYEKLRAWVLTRAAAEAKSGGQGEK